MTSFDWADDGVFDISDDDAFTNHFNQMSQEEKREILDALNDETRTAEQRKKAIDFLAKAGEMVIKFGGILA